MNIPAVDDHVNQTHGPTTRLSPAEFAEQFREAFNVLWLIAVGVVGERTQAEDVVQEAAIIALGKLDRFQPGTSFIAWMGQTVRYVALNSARKERKRRAVLQDVQRAEASSSSSFSSSATGGSSDSHGGAGGSAAEGGRSAGSSSSAASRAGGGSRPLRLTPDIDLPPDQTHFDDRIVHALSEVGDVARACLLLRTVNDMPYAEIARVLDIPEGTAMSHVHRTRIHLRERLGAGVSRATGGGASSKSQATTESAGRPRGGVA